MSSKKNQKSTKSVKKPNYNEQLPIFKDPSESIAGKIIVWILILGMGALIIVGTIVGIINVVKTGLALWF
jgi:hypothetical protein